MYNNRYRGSVYAQYQVTGLHCQSEDLCPVRAHVGTVAYPAKRERGRSYYERASEVSRS
ncbi:MAG: hypothetical protein MIO87_04215 [Methanomassiliicoccales archaeon]|nr:hypothetical protein [Methanomassiliicoccales archaeon]